MSIIERIDESLNPHPGVQHYVDTGHEVVYHGNAGRFRVYTASKSDSPGVRSARSSDKHHLDHQDGKAILASAKTVNDHLDNLGMPKHSISVIQASRPAAKRYDIETMRHHGTPSLLRTQGDEKGHYERTSHHIWIAPGFGDPSNLIHEWGHHHQAQLSRHQKEALKDAHVAALTDLAQGHYYNKYGRTSWAERHSTSLEASMRGKSTLMSRIADMLNGTTPMSKSDLKAQGIGKTAGHPPSEPSAADVRRWKSRRK